MSTEWMMTDMREIHSYRFEQLKTRS